MEQKNKLEKAREQNLGEIKRLDNRIDRMNNELQLVGHKLQSLKNENPWVLAEKDMFGNPESAEYANVDKIDLSKQKLRFHRIQEENEKLKKMINVRVDEMAD